MGNDVIALASAWSRDRADCWRSECPSGAGEYPHPFTDGCRWANPLTTAEPAEAPAPTPPPTEPVTAPEPDVSAIAGDRDVTIAAIRTALRRRTGRTWSVTGGRGTSWGWIRITAPPARRAECGYLTDEDRAILADALGLDTVHQQGESIPAGIDYRIEYVDRAEGRPPSRIGEPFWD